MNKKFVIILLSIVATLCLGAVVAGCKSGEPSHEHQLTAFEEVGATCTSEGRTAYWYCSGCGKYFSDGNATNEITYADTVVAAKGHSYGEYVYDSENLRYVSTCTACNDIKTVTAGLSEDYPYIATDEENLIAAVEIGGYIKLNEDIVISEQIEVTGEVTLNLNGHTVSNIRDVWDDSDGVKAWSLVSVQGGNLTINGNGGFIAKENDCFAADVRNGGSLTINGGAFGGNCHSVYVHTGQLEVNGGFFYVMQQSGNPDPYGYVLNCFDASYKDGTAVIVVNGGTYVNFNPSDCAAEGENTDFVSVGHTVASESGKGESLDEIWYSVT